MRPLLVGEQNPYGRDPRYALYPEPPNSAGGRLCRLVMGLTVKQYVARFDRVNLCIGKWSKRAAREEACRIIAERGDSPVVLCGSKVSEAFGVHFEPFTYYASRAVRYVVLPHPSGLCRLWNEPGAFLRARGLLREAGVLSDVVTHSAYQPAEGLMRALCGGDGPRSIVRQKVDCEACLSVEMCANCGAHPFLNNSCPDCGSP